MFKNRLTISSVALVSALCASLLCSGCGKSSQEKSAQSPSAAMQFNAEKAADARAREEMTRKRHAMEEANQTDISKESEETFKKFGSERPTMTAVEETKAQDDAVERLRARMADPSTVQVRNVQINAGKTAVCMEVNFQEGGKYIGFRRAFATPDGTWIEPNSDEVAHRVFELKMEKLACNVRPATGTGQ